MSKLRTGDVPEKPKSDSAETLTASEQAIAPSSEALSSSIFQLIFIISGIYASFLTWAVLQERISTTPYGEDGRVFRASFIINVLQSAFAALFGYLYLQYKRRSGSSRDMANYSAPVFEDIKVLKQYLLVAFCQTLSSPFAYASLKYVDYLTMLLAKSCKLLPVMFLHLTVYRRKYPAYKYIVVLVITLGVSLFTICHPSASSKASSKSSSSWTGLGLLSINLLLDGFYNTTQDHMFHANKNITGAHMMCGLNLLSAVITFAVLISPFNNQLTEGLAFIHEHPQVFRDILAFAVCGGLGQLFIFSALEKYGSLILVTVTVTRKMLSMLLSVIWFNHKLSIGQWVGVGCVFAAVCAESFIKYREKASKSGKSSAKDSVKKKKE